MRALKICLYTLLKFIGVFGVAKRSTAAGLRILCYHGISTTDTHEWRPVLFMRPNTFRRRMEHLANSGYTVLDLEDAVDRLRSRNLPRNSVVITIDDGFSLTAEHAVPILKENRLPATIYVTSYYVEKQTPVFRLILQYMAWKNPEGVIDLEDLGIPLEARLTAQDAQDPTRAALQSAIDFGDTSLDNSGRVALAKKMAEQLSLDYAQIETCSTLTLMSESQIKQCVAQGIDVQLHTRRHKFPLDRESAIAELTENRSDLEPIVGKQLEHFCYPSGRWDEQHWSWLSETGIKSATTTDGGFNYYGDNTLALKRFLDSDDFTDIEFEAELVGVAEFLRRLRTFLRGQAGAPRTAAD